MDTSACIRPRPPVSVSISSPRFRRIDSTLGASFHWRHGHAGRLHPNNTTMKFNDNDLAHGTVSASMPGALRELYSSTAAMNAPSAQRMLDLSRYAVRPYDIAGQFLTHPTTAVSKILGKSLFKKTKTKPNQCRVPNEIGNFPAIFSQPLSVRPDEIADGKSIGTFGC